jgi:hypothetical protein
MSRTWFVREAGRPKAHRLSLHRSRHGWSSSIPTTLLQRRLLAGEGSTANNAAVTAKQAGQIPARGLLILENLLEQLETGDAYGPVEIHWDLLVVAVSRVSVAQGHCQRLTRSTTCSVIRRNGGGRCEKSRILA